MVFNLRFLGTPHTAWLTLLRNCIYVVMPICALASLVLALYSQPSPVILTQCHSSVPSQTVPKHSAMNDICGGGPAPGGGRPRTSYVLSDLAPYYLLPARFPGHRRAEFLRQVDRCIISSDYDSDEFVITAPVLSLLVGESRPTLEGVIRRHNLDPKRGCSVNVLRATLPAHQSCLSCHSLCLVFRLLPDIVDDANVVSNKRLKNIKGRAVQHPDANAANPPVVPIIVQSQFPPRPPSKRVLENVVRGYVGDMNPDNWVESGCKVCGLLVLHSDSSPYRHDLFDERLLYPGELNVTRKERHDDRSSVQTLTGPVLDPSCSRLCNTCLTTLSEGRIPELALVNGNWIGAVPDELTGLSWAEKMLICRVTSNRCVARVAKSGFSRLTGNAVFFETPVPKVYKVLPPSQSELSEVLAYVFMGPSRPSTKDHGRIPLLVNKNKVSRALEWLKLNHSDYKDLEISYDNLNEYPSDVPPVSVQFTESPDFDPSENLALHQTEDPSATDSGECNFIVHGLTGDKIEGVSSTVLKAESLKHLRRGGKALGVGRSENPESTYDNPQLYPQMFPWLFPYGLGGIGNTNGMQRVPDPVRKHSLLMYHDKRFQMDPLFPLAAFNQEQVQKASLGGYLLSDKKVFASVSERVASLDLHVLDALIDKLKNNGYTDSTSQAEKDCYRLLSDLDHVAGKVKGSRTSQKWKRNEAWSMITHLGAPSWFITIAPADQNSPLCLMFASPERNDTFKVDLLDPRDKVRLVGRNPVASARFFNIVACLFIKHVLGHGSDQQGIFGETSGFYGTVEQQGRLTLHLHILLWIANALTPQEIRDRILDVTSSFQQELVEYLESVHMGEFFDGKSMQDIAVEVTAKENDGKTSGLRYVPPTETLPSPPPKPCHRRHDRSNSFICAACDRMSFWWDAFKSTVNELVWRTNRHECGSHCLSNKYGTCKARYPREVRTDTTVDPETGYLNLKKGEAWMNTFSSVLTYLLRSNTDVTSLLSGTAIKAVIAYVTDYVTKPQLQTHVLFETVRSVLGSLSESIGGNVKQRADARLLLVKMVNALTSKSSIGGPMACMYLLGHPDVYCSHEMITIYWYQYIKFVKETWKVTDMKEDSSDEKLVLASVDESIVPVDHVLDYCLRPAECESMCLWDWWRRSKKCKSSEKMKLSRRAALSRDTLYVPVFADGCSADQDDPMSTPDSGVSSDAESSSSSNHARSSSNNKRKFRDIDVSTGNSDKGANQLTFLMEHKQFMTHHINIASNDIGVVLNLSGGSLPRRDRGNTEEYCLTMLSFFKPWRTSKELKPLEQTWQEAYDAHKWTTRDIRIMKNMHVKYECNDARDDYNSQLKQGQHAIKKFHDSMDDRAASDLAKDGSLNEIMSMYTTEERLQSLSDYVGPGWKEDRAKMDDISTTLRTVGWLDHTDNPDCGTGGPDGASGYDPITFEPVNGSLRDKSEWKAELQATKEAILSLRLKQANEAVRNGTIPKIAKQHIDSVVEVDESYLTNEFVSGKPESKIEIRSIVDKFSLNEEQERAFRIVAQHASHPSGEQLRMYLGGMAGTGKSQVIKALMAFFDGRQESYAFVVVAPTAAAATLVVGSTYHSLLGFAGSVPSQSQKSLQKVRERLQYVSYMFVDEISMVDCLQFYNMSAQMSLSLDVSELAFGGRNLVVSGDFAQLPPSSGGYSLYSHVIGSVVHKANSVQLQCTTMGKALWHTFTTVVILNQNMRQKGSTADDLYFRQILVDLRHCACTEEQLEWMNSRIAGRGPGQTRVSNPDVKYASIITAWNAARDKINDLGAPDFARHINREIHTFYSVDRWSSAECDPRISNRRTKKSTMDVLRDSDNVDLQMQYELWKVHPARTEHHPGMLQLCIGMPVLVKHNEATEAGVTNGAEGHVVGWNSHAIGEGKQVLDTLFVKLKLTASTVRVKGLPDDVVPIAAYTKAIAVKLSDDSMVRISRTQVPVVLNFGMTDYGSQGRSRPHNPFDPGECRSHQSLYTCLSRGTSWSSTVLIRPIPKDVAIGKLSQQLRKEFQQLELLNVITKMRFDGSLPDHVRGETRTELIRSFQLWKGVDWCPTGIHPAIRWSKANPLGLMNVEQASNWQVVANRQTVNTTKTKSGDTQTSQYVIAKGTSTLATTNEDPFHIRKFRAGVNGLHQPMGTRWDPESWSCAFDALLTILHLIYSTCNHMWADDVADSNVHMKMITDSWIRHPLDPNVAKAEFQRAANTLDQDAFPIDGTRGTSIASLCELLLRSAPGKLVRVYSCDSCKQVSRRRDVSSLHFTGSSGDPVSINSTANTARYFINRAVKKCRCGSTIRSRVSAAGNPPSVYAVGITSITTISATTTLDFTSVKPRYFLAGIIYHGANHFTSRLLDKGKNVWAHDGMMNGGECQYEGKISDIPSLIELDGRSACIAVYCKVQTSSQ